MSDTTNRVYEPYIQNVEKLKSFFEQSDGLPIPNPIALNEIEMTGNVEVVTTEPAITAELSSVNPGNSKLTRISNLVAESNRDSELYNIAKKQYIKDIKNSSNYDIKAPDPSEPPKKKEKIQTKPAKKQKKIKSLQDIFTMQ